MIVWWRKVREDVETCQEDATKQLAEKIKSELESARAQTNYWTDTVNAFNNSAENSQLNTDLTNFINEFSNLKTNQDMGGIG